MAQRTLTWEGLSEPVRRMSVEGCGLTWDEIRRIRRYTANFNPAVEEQLRTAWRRELSQPGTSGGATPMSYGATLVSCPRPGRATR